MKEEPQYELTEKGKEMAEKMSAIKTSTALPKLENTATVGEAKTTQGVLLGQIYDLMVQMREDEVTHREKIKNLKQKDLSEEETKRKNLLEAIRGKKPTKKAKKGKKRKPGRPKKEPGLFQAALGGIVAAAAVKDKAREEEKAKAEAPTPTAPPPPKKVEPEPTKVEVKPTTVPAPTTTPVPSTEEKKPTKLTKPPAGPGFQEGKNKMLQAMDSKGIKDPMARAQILAQAAHESGGFKYTQELGNEQYFRKYEGRKDLGNTQPGDGIAFIGRGFLQTTGRTNYQQFKDKFNIDVINEPQKLAEPINAAKSALFWFEKNAKKVEKLSAGDWTNTKAVTKAVNGGFNGLADREKYFEIFRNDPEVTGGKPTAITATTPSSKGTQLAAASETNKDLKDKIQKDKSAQMANINKTTNVAQNQTSEQQQKGPADDRPAYLKKAAA